MPNDKVAVTPAKSVFNPEYNRLIGQLSEARRSSGITQAELARRLGRPQSYVSKYEHGERRLDVLEFMVITRALGLKASSIIAVIEEGKSNG